MNNSRIIENSIAASFRVTLAKIGDQLGILPVATPKEYNHVIWTSGVGGKAELRWFIVSYDEQRSVYLHNRRDHCDLPREVVEEFWHQIICGPRYDFGFGFHGSEINPESLEHILIDMVKFVESVSPPFSITTDKDKVHKFEFGNFGLESYPEWPYRALSTKEDAHMDYLLKHPYRTK